MKNHRKLAACRRLGLWQSASRLAGLFAVGLAFLTTSAAHADFIFTVNDVSAVAGSTGNTTLEVSLTNSGSVASPQIAAFQFQLMVQGTSGVTFADVDTLTASHPYLFGTNTSAPPLSFDAFPNTAFTASDLYTIPNSGVSLGAGQTLGLGRVTFDVSLSAIGLVPVTLVPNFNDSLLDPNGDPIDATYHFVNGSIRVLPVAAVPEPASLVLAFLGITAGSVGCACHARRAITPSGKRLRESQ